MAPPDEQASGSLVWDERPDLERPVLVAAFEGWNDAAEVATTAVDWLRHRWDARPFARIDPDGYFDFQSVRPQVVLSEGVTRELRWPSNECFAATVESGARDAVLLSGTEPSFRWRGFCGDVLEVVTALDVRMVVTLGALLADVPHTRPVRITGAAGDEDLARRIGLERSRYEGPTGIVGVLHDACRTRGVASASLWAPVPHYVASAPNPVATAALLQAVSGLLSAPTDTAELAPAAETWRQRVDAAVAADPETEEYVSVLEEQYDSQIADRDLPAGEELIDQIQAFLREEAGEVDPGSGAEDPGDD